MDALARLLRELVAIPSPSGEEAALGDHVAERLRKAGFEVERAGDGVVAEAGPERAPVLMLCSHLDTVPAGAAWSADPWRVEWKDDRLIGLGANDAKASVAAMLMAGEHWLAGAARRGFRLRLAFNALEETTNHGMEELLASRGMPDAAVIGEPTDLEVVNAQSGLAVLEAEWSGRSCHAAHVGRVEHENALLAAARDLAHFPPCLTLGEPHAQCGISTVAATVLHAGDRHNKVPDRAIATLDARLAPDVDAERALAEVQKLLPNATVRVRSARLKPFETPAAHPWVHAALQAAGRSAPIGSSTMSDMALLQGIPAVKCGPGRTERSHTPDEFVTREELEAGFRFYARFLELAPVAQHA
ncbi:MAG: M20/M25/M40 family metallo-hydrolase [Planctomycetota bacterium]|nr:M20/M25/M40 family metallo-hydrolase [Planctomycetota bacterium]